MKSRLRNNNAGMSLVEVLIAMLILAVISVPLIKYFTDSLEHSIKTAQKQQATAEAQSLMEDLESQYALIEAKEDPTTHTEVYDAYYLTQTLGFARIEGSAFDPDTAIGKGVYRKAEADYDVEVIVETNVDFNNTAHPVVNGVDDTRDVFAVETNQAAEALLHFQAVNAAYDEVTEGNQALTADEISAIMNKEIHVVIDKTTGALGYTIAIYYVYSCSGDGWPGPDSTYRSNCLYQGEKQQLDNLYILYNRKISGIQNAEDEDKVIIERTAAAGAICPELYLVCQNPVNDSKYEVLITALNNQVIHSNIGNATDPNKGKIKSSGGTELLVQPLTGSEKTLRIADITVSIYKTGYIDDPDTGTLYVTMSSTKGE